MATVAEQPLAQPTGLTPRFFAGLFINKHIALSSKKELLIDMEYIVGQQIAIIRIFNWEGNGDSQIIVDINNPFL